MNVEQLRAYCLSLPHSTEDMPFGDTVLVMRLAGKIYALLSLDPPHTINLKCGPGRALELREQYDAIRPGYHMNKQHWNTVDPPRLPEKLVKELIVHSYELIKASLPKKIREELGG